MQLIRDVLRGIDSSRHLIPAERDAIQDPEGLRVAREGDCTAYADRPGRARTSGRGIHHHSGDLTCEHLVDAGDGHLSHLVSTDGLDR